MDIKLTEKQGEFLVGLALALRGSSLLFAKIAMRTMGPFLLMGTRFIIAFIVIGLIFRKNLVSVTKKDALRALRAEDDPFDHYGFPRRRRRSYRAAAHMHSAQEAS